MATNDPRSLDAERFARAAVDIGYAVSDTLLSAASVAFDRMGALPGSAGSGASFDRLLDAVSGVVREAGDAARDAAHSGADRMSAAGSGSTSADGLSTSGTQGGEATVELVVHNTGNVPLKDVVFIATDLIAPVGTWFAGISGRAVTFEPPHITRIGPRGRGTTKVTVQLDPDQDEGCYRGLLFAHPGGACIVIDVTVRPVPPPPPGQSAQPAQPASVSQPPTATHS